MSKDINGALLDGVLSKVRADIGRYPRRTVRNLLDLGEKLARGQSQKTFLGNARDMLEKRSSAYYKAVEDMVSHVDLDHLFTFGKNVGYNSCLKGSRIIGEIRDKEGYSAPWALSLVMDEDRLSRTPELYDQVIVQGMGIGIYTYLLFGPETKDLLLLSRTHPECAFVLFVRGQELDEAFLSQLALCRNVLLAVEDDRYMDDNCRVLRENKLFYGIYTAYDDVGKEHILNGCWLSDILPDHPQFAFLLPREDSTPRSKAQVYDYMISIRKGQKYPVFLMDIGQDMITINEMVLKDRCAVYFDQEGMLHIHGRPCPEITCNIFEESLTDIFRQTLSSEE